MRSYEGERKFLRIDHHCGIGFSVCVACLQTLKTDRDKELAKHEEEVQEAMEKHATELQEIGKPLLQSVCVVPLTWQSFHAQRTLTTRS